MQRRKLLHESDHSGFQLKNASSSPEELSTSVCCKGSTMSLYFLVQLVGKALKQGSIAKGKLAKSNILGSGKGLGKSMDLKWVIL